MKNALKLDKLNRLMVVLQMLFALCMFILLSTLGANGLAKAQAAPIKKTVLDCFHIKLSPVNDRAQAFVGIWQRRHSTLTCI